VDTIERRAPVQADRQRPAGSITWAEHLAVYEAYARKYGRSQSAERIAERGGFGYDEAALIGVQLKTWVQR